MDPRSELPAVQDLSWPLIPAPREFRPAAGSLDWDSVVRITLDPLDPGLDRLARTLAAELAPILGRTLPVRVGPAAPQESGSLRLQRAPGAGPEAYTLTVHPQGMNLAGADDAGMFHGIQTVVQLMAVASDPDLGAPIGCGTASDAPRHRWRGMLLDCGRHFMPVSVVKGVIDRLARYKFNVLHWHLTEDQGWRLEIPRYPRLTQVSAWRSGTDGRRYGGFYTVEQVREIVAYAADRHITVVPEIELPGHSKAALAAYPELSCTGGPFAVETQWGIHEDIYCAGKEETFTFLENVLDQVLELFPSPMIHIGGDEAPRDRWRACPDCQARIRAEGLQDEDDLQRWFVQRIGRFLSGRGRRLVGWDEILQGGLAEEGGAAVVQAWRGMDGARQAVRAGLEAVVSPTTHCYFDYDVGVLDLQRVYGFDPVPEGLSPAEQALILGGEMNLWTEYIPPERVDAMLLPRMCAMAEALWTGTAGRDYAAFWNRLQRHRPVLAALDAKPGAEARPLESQCALAADHRSHVVAVTVDPRVRLAFTGHELVVRHRVLPEPPPGYRPDLPAEQPALPPLTAADPALPEPLEAAPGTGANPQLALTQLFIDGVPYGAPDLAEFSTHLALGKTVTLTTPPIERYSAGGGAGLVDGMFGPRSFKDGRWAGFEGEDFEAVIDLQETAEVAAVAVRFLQDANRWIFLPKRVEICYAVDEGRWSRPEILEHGLSDKEQTVTIRTFATGGEPRQARFIRVRALSLGVCPTWHPGRGLPCWVFTDEIVVR